LQLAKLLGQMGWTHLRIS